MSDDLVNLGAGVGSSNESLKLESNHLRGTIARALQLPTSHLEEGDLQLLKFHGSYQQEDRDQRQERKKAGLEKAYQFMIRSRIPGGVLTSEQYLAHDEIARRYGNGSVRLTTRQGIQLHGVLKSDLRPTIRAINATLLDTLAACGDVNRNVMACPAPARSRAHAEVQRYAHAIAEHLKPRTKAYHEIWLEGEKLENEDSAGEAALADHEPMYGKTYLPRKFKIAVAYPGDNCVDIYTQDIGFIAELDGERLSGFTLVIGGGMGSTHGKAETYPRLATPLCFARPDEVLELAETIVTIQRDYGDRKNRRHARMKYLVEERGMAWFRQELETRLGRAIQDPHAIVFDDIDDHLGWHEQADGDWFLGLSVQNGRVNDTVSGLLGSALREIAKRFAPALHVTGQQNVLLCGIRADDRDAVGAILREHGVEADPVALGLHRRAMACPALPTCGLAVTDAERALPGLVDEIECELVALGLEDEPIGIRMTGCPNGCARPRLGDIGIVGRSLGIYDLFLGGDGPSTRLNALYAQGVKRGELVATLRPIFDIWKRERVAGERFGDFVARYGIDALRNRSKELATA